MTIYISWLDALGFGSSCSRCNPTISRSPIPTRPSPLVRYGTRPVHDSYLLRLVVDMAASYSTLLRISARKLSFSFSIGALFISSASPSEDFTASASVSSKRTDHLSHLASRHISYTQSYAAPVRRLIALTVWLLQLLADKVATRRTFPLTAADLSPLNLDSSKYTSSFTAIDLLKDIGVKAAVTLC